MKVLIVDDEPLARARLQRLLADFSEYSLVGTASDVASARQLCSQTQPDVLLLDIEMPGQDGLAFAAELTQLPLPPAVILVTAHPQHALQAYSVNPADYILKPVSAERLAQALGRLRQKTRAQLQIEPIINYQLGNQQRQMLLSKVMYFTADDKYVRMVFKGGEALLEQSLSQLLKRFPVQLLRIHRSTLINRSFFDYLFSSNDGRHFVKLFDMEPPLEVSRRCLSQLRQQLGLN